MMTGKIDKDDFLTWKFWSLLTGNGTQCESSPTNGTHDYEENNLKCEGLKSRGIQRGAAIPVPDGCGMASIFGSDDAEREMLRFELLVSKVTVKLGPPLETGAKNFRLLSSVALDGDDGVSETVCWFARDASSDRISRIRDELPLK